MNVSGTNLNNFGITKGMLLVNRRQLFNRMKKSYLYGRSIKGI